MRRVYRFSVDLRVLYGYRVVPAAQGRLPALLVWPDGHNSGRNRMCSDSLYTDDTGMLAGDVRTMRYVSVFTRLCENVTF